MPPTLSRENRSTDPHLNVVSHNVRGLRPILRCEPDPKSELVQDHLESYGIVCLQETWLLENESHFLGATFDCQVAVAHATKDLAKGGRPAGGLAILWRDTHAVTHVTSSQYFCAVRVACDFGDFVLVNVYMPCGKGGDSHGRFRSAIMELNIFLESMTGEHIIMTGDFNVDFAKHAPNRVNILRELLTSQQMTCADLRYEIPFTYEHENGGTSYVDHFAITKGILPRVKAIDVDFTATQPSDHHPIFLNLTANFATPTIPAAAAFTTIAPDEPTSHSVATHRVKPHHIANFKSNFKLQNDTNVIDHAVHQCCIPNCKACIPQLDSFASCLVQSFAAASECLPKTKPPRNHTKAKWDDEMSSIKARSVFWNDLWVDCGCQTTGVVYLVRNATRKAYRKAVRAWFKRQDELKQENASLSYLLNPTNAMNRIFQHRKRLSSHSTRPKSVDGFSDPQSIANTFAARYSAIYNRVHSDSDPNFNISPESCAEIFVTDETVRSALKRMKPGKCDNDRILSDYLIWAGDDFIHQFARFLTACFRHGHFPNIIGNAVLCPIPKKGKDAQSSEGYRSIALASQLSKLVEYVVLSKYGSCLVTSDLQFAYKPKTGTTACTALYKATIEHFSENGTPIFSALLDMSKAFDLIPHRKLVDVLKTRGLHENMQRFFYAWYRSQRLSVRYGAPGTLSDDFGVSNGVRQGGVVSPIFFTIYMDILLDLLKAEGAGCYVANVYVGALCYADDLTLIAPSLSALRRMLKICEDFGRDYGMTFNAGKTQLIFFGKSVLSKSRRGEVYFCGSKLEWVESVLHLGVRLCSNLSETADIARISNKFHMVVHTMLSQFPYLKPDMKTNLFRTLAGDLYGAILWRLTRTNLNPPSIAYNQCLRKIWKTFMCHLPILRVVSEAPSLSAMMKTRVSKFYKSILNPTNVTTCTAFSYFILFSSETFISHNFWHRNFIPDVPPTQAQESCGNMIREIRLNPEIYQFLGPANAKYLVEWASWGTRA